jgi:ADP-ribose pyrophosphatase
MRGVAAFSRCFFLLGVGLGVYAGAASLQTTAIKELEEETGFTAERVERLGDFYASPGMLSESFTLVRAHGVRKIGEGGGTESEDINVHLVPRTEIANFIEQKRAEGFGVDVKLLLFLNF